MKGTQRPGSVPAASVFLDPTGRRKRWSRLLFRLTMAGFAAYIGLLAASLIGSPRLVPRPSAGLHHRFTYQPPTWPATVAGPDDRSTSAAVGVPDYAAALEGIAAPVAAGSRPATPVSLASSKRGGAVNDAPAGASRPDIVTVTTILRSSDWPLPTRPPADRAAPPAPTAPTTTSTTTSPPPTTPPTTDAPGGSPQPTTTTTTAPAPAPTTTDGRGPAGDGPPGWQRKTASQPTG